MKGANYEKDCTIISRGIYDNAHYFGSRGRRFGLLNSNAD